MHTHFLKHYRNTIMRERKGLHKLTEKKIYTHEEQKKG